MCVPLLFILSIKGAEILYHLNLGQHPTAEDHQEHTYSQQSWVYYLLHKGHGPPCGSPWCLRKASRRGLLSTGVCSGLGAVREQRQWGDWVSSFLIRGPGRGQRLWLVQRLVIHVAWGEGDVSHFYGSVFACIWSWWCTFCLTASLLWWPCLVLVSCEFYVCRRTHGLAVMARLADGSQGCCWLHLFTKHLLLSFRHSHNTISLKPHNPVRDNDLHFIGKKTKRWVSFHIHPLKEKHTQMFLEAWIQNSELWIQELLSHSARSESLRRPRLPQDFLCYLEVAAAPGRTGLPRQRPWPLKVSAGHNRGAHAWSSWAQGFCRVEKMGTWTLSAMWPQINNFPTLVLSSFV